MRLIVLVAACWACAGHARRTKTISFQQQTADQITENGVMPQSKKLARLLLASSSLAAGAYSQANMQSRIQNRVWAFCSQLLAGAPLEAELLQKRGGVVVQEESMAVEEEEEKEKIAEVEALPTDLTLEFGDEKGHIFADPLAGTHSQAEVEFLQKQEQVAEVQTPPEFDNSWALGDEKGRIFADPIAGTHSQAEVEFMQKQKRWRKSAELRGVFSGQGGDSAEKAPPIDNTWALGYEKGQTFAGPIAGTHSQAEVEFSQKQQTMANVQSEFDNSWALGDEKGRKFADPIAGAHSQAEVEFKQKQQKWYRR